VFTLAADQQTAADPDSVPVFRIPPDWTKGDKRWQWLASRPVGSGRLSDADLSHTERELERRKSAYANLPPLVVGGFAGDRVVEKMEAVRAAHNAAHQWDALAPTLEGHVRFTRRVLEAEIDAAVSGGGRRHPEALLRLRDALHALFLALADGGRAWFNWADGKPTGDPQRDIEAAAAEVADRLADAEHLIPADLAPDSPARPEAIRETLAFLSPVWGLESRGEDDLRALTQRVETAREHLIGKKSRHDPIPGGPSGAAGTGISEPDTPAVESTPQAEAKRKRRPKRDTAQVTADNDTIREHLRKNPDATRDQTAEATGISAAHVSESRAWKAHSALRDEARKANRPSDRMPDD
jgi:hypothetical protein